MTLRKRLLILAAVTTAEAIVLTAWLLVVDRQLARTLQRTPDYQGGHP